MSQLSLKNQMMLKLLNQLNLMNPKNQQYQLNL
jgi:hypothetical protein